MNAIGTIKLVKAEGGWGFIKREGHGDKDVFFHRSALQPGLEFTESLRGTRVSVDYDETDKGFKATSVKRLSGRGAA